MKKLLMLLFVLLFAAGSSFAVTVITNQAELQAMANDVAGDYVLGNNIVLTGTFTSIMEFSGTFDGAFYTIDGLSTSNAAYNNPGIRTNGLFGRTVAGSLIQNVGLTNVHIVADASVPDANPNYIGALVGDSKGEVRNCFLEGGTISLTGATNGNNGGSLVGLMRNTGSIKNCYVLGTSVTINGMNGIGGFINSNGQGLIENCYVAGTVDLTPRDPANASGFGRDLGGTGVITSCYYNMGLTTFMGTPTWDDGSGMGRTTEQMLTQANYEGWDFENTWKMDEGESYPTLIGFGPGMNPSPANGAVVLPGDVELSWTNIQPDPDNPIDLYIEVMFGTDPNEEFGDMTALVLDPASGLDVNSVTVEGLTEGTYYWRVNTDIGEPNMSQGPLWKFHVVSDPAPVIDGITPDQMTWSGEPVPLTVTVTNEGPSATIYEWTADPADNVVITGGDTATPTVTITKMPYSEAKIANAGFEDSVLADGGYAGAAGWGWYGTDYKMVTNPYSDYAIGDYPTFGGIAPEGQNMAQTGAGGIAQVLNETLAADTTYTLTAMVGRPGFTHTWDGYMVQLLAGGTAGNEGNISEGTLLAENANSVTIEPNSIELITVIFDSTGVDPALLGESLQIRLLSGPTAEPIFFDDVHLTADPGFPALKGVETVTMTVLVSDEKNPIPVEASMDIDVYGDACTMARLGQGADDLNDLNKDCDIDVEDLSLVAAKWLNDLSLDGAVISPSEPNTVPNGNFELLYKPGTDIIGNVAAGGWSLGVGPGCPIESGIYEFADGTTGTVADIAGWVGYDVQGWIDNGGSYSRDQTRGPGDNQGAIAAQGPYAGKMCYLSNGGDWGNAAGGLITSAAPLGTFNPANYTLSMMARGVAIPVVFDLLADGVVITPDSSVDPVLSDQWQEYSRTYSAATVEGLLGQDLTIALGVGRESTGTQSKFDDVKLDIEIIDENLPTVDAGENMLTWSGEPVTLAATTVNNDTQVPQRNLSYLWTAKPADGVTIEGADTLTPTVTITKDAGDKASVRLMLAVTLDGAGTMTDAVTVDVYDDSCQAAMVDNPNLEFDLTDLNGDCITNLKDFASIAAAWLADYSSTEAVDKVK